jgi:hypothetical protein
VGLELVVNGHSAQLNSPGFDWAMWGWNKGFTVKITIASIGSIGLCGVGTLPSLPIVRFG